MPHPEPDHPATVTVAVVDDHDAIHAGVQAWCAQADPPIRVVGEYTDAVSVLAGHPIGVAGLDVVLLDLELISRTTDFAALQAIRAAGRRVIVYSHIVHDGHPALPGPRRRHLRGQGGGSTAADDEGSSPMRAHS